ncbi:histidinol phosphate phosphatase [Saccharibacter sp. 17.LH.SD]|uniref:inositol monophosphatase family protein n=1 Tax=Saccharibacter sp. 17.LH.SD TaxID=2689393 RepID=UPI00136A41A1|nr:inositol monophosphatase family protein [Saccharibacter sp. 17.LH.SD]MXV44220.1 histidinol phosphate phosphatase [Saccharibacter sp. 17.LH.SD]
MTEASFDHFLTVAHQCADAARQAVLPHFRMGLETLSKSDDSPVTLADRQAEDVMRTLIKKHYPHHSMWGEEGGQEGTMDAEWLWVIDPIDGTRSFVTGRPSFCTLISLFHYGRPVLGLIDQPVTEERWTGIKGQPSRYHSPRLAGKIGTRKHTALRDAELSCTSPDILRPEKKAGFHALQKATRRTSWGGDAYAFGLLSLGQIDIIAEDTMKPWDWAALVPVIEGAGGTITDWKGQPLHLESDGTVLACGNPTLLPHIIETLS